MYAANREFYWATQWPLTYYFAVTEPGLWRWLCFYTQILIFSINHWSLNCTAHVRISLCPPLFLPLFFSPVLFHSGELRTQKLKSHLVRTQSLNVLPLKPGVGQYIAIHATLTARDFFLAYFCPSGPFTCIFSKTSRDFFQLAVAHRFLCRPAE